MVIRPTGKKSNKVLVRKPAGSSDDQTDDNEYGEGEDTEGEATETDEDRDSEKEDSRKNLDESGQRTQDKEGKEGEESEEDIAALPVIDGEEKVTSLPVGAKFLAGFIHTPERNGFKTDMQRQAEMDMEMLLSGQISRNGLSPEYWRAHSATRPPRGERTDSGYRLLD